MLDRDGVINHDSKDYIKSPDEWIPMPDSFKAISLLTKAGIKVGVATNQSGIGRGYYTEATLSLIHEKMVKGAQNVGGTINKIVYCPHLPTAACPCRKPKAGLLFELANFFGGSPKGHYYIGDKKSDIQAAYECGAIPLFINSSLYDLEEEFSNVQRFDSLLLATHFILNV